MKETFSNLRKVYEYGKEYKKNFIAFCLLSIVAIIVNIIYPIFSAKVLTYLTGSVYKKLIYTVIIILLLDISNAIRTLVIKRNTQVFFRGSFKNIQLKLGQEILKLQVKEFDTHSSGLFIERLNRDCSELSHIFTMGAGFVTGILSNIGVFIAVLIINPKVFLFYLISFLIISYFYILKTKKVLIKEKIMLKQKENQVGLTSELVRGARDIKMLNAEKPFLIELDKSITDLSNKKFMLRNTDSNYNLLISIIIGLIECLLIFLLIYLLKYENMSISTALILYSYRKNIMENLVEKVGGLIEEIKNFNLSCKRVFSILDIKEFKKETFGNKHLPKVNGNFEFKDVYFSYNKKTPVLEGLSFEVNANETVGFVGKSGVGKTTIFNLLCKMYEIDKGQILIDGININELDKESLRGNITIISQNPYIFNMSIRDNLRLVKENVSDSQIKKVCKLALLDEFIDTLPNKYDTICGEGGTILSGGQKQRLAIARALLQKTEIILFDEATSALDNDTQNKIQAAINNMKNKYTILIIAHRLSTIINCDRIYFIENGKVLDSGSHIELLKRCKPYQKLYEKELKEDK